MVLLPEFLCLMNAKKYWPAAEQHAAFLCYARRGAAVREACQTDGIVSFCGPAQAAQLAKKAEQAAQHKPPIWQSASATQPEKAACVPREPLLAGVSASARFSRIYVCCKDPAPVLSAAEFDDPPGNFRRLFVRQPVGVFLKHDELAAVTESQA
jgi:hypothetical protein